VALALCTARSVARPMAGARQSAARTRWHRALGDRARIPGVRTLGPYSRKTVPRINWEPGRLTVEARRNRAENQPERPSPPTAAPRVTLATGRAQRARG